MRGLRCATNTPPRTGTGRWRRRWLGSLRVTPLNVNTRPRLRTQKATCPDVGLQSLFTVTTSLVRKCRELLRSESVVR